MNDISRQKDIGNKKIVVIGAGIGGLTAAAALSRAGLDVTVLEAHIYPGGCAGTFYHQGYHFDAGATLSAGFYRGGPMEKVSLEAGISSWPVHTAPEAMQIHFPDGANLILQNGEQRWVTRRETFGTASLEFFRWQESTADVLWNLAMRLPPWPPSTTYEWVELIKSGSGWLRNLGYLPSFERRQLLLLLMDAFRPVAAHLGNASERLRLFVDAQLLISSQAISTHANALYGASALDLPRRGVVHLEGGMGSIAQTLVEAVRQNGGQVLYRQEATRIVYEAGHPVAVETRKGGSFPAQIVIVNLPPWNVLPLMGDMAPPRLKSLPEQPADGWGAFMVYIGFDESTVPDEFPLHHQVIAQRPLGEGNTAFLSLSPAWDTNRAPKGQRAMTISTHTALAPWWELFEKDRSAYERRKNEYTQRLIATAETAIPGLREAATRILPGTPVTFQYFTRRVAGWVGGFPQTSLFRSWHPKLADDLWMVGDSIFPGQSTAAVALGGLRVAQSVLHSMQAAPQNAIEYSQDTALTGEKFSETRAAY
jgi:C-3',4' desaturase CrtD